MYTNKGRLDSKGDPRLVEYYPLVVKLAHHLVAKLPASVDVQDLIQAGLIGLMDAISRFEVVAGAQFSTYANTRIRGAMLDEVRRNDWMPTRLRRKQRSVEKAMQVAQQKLGRHASDSEVASVMGLSIEQYQKLLMDTRGVSVINITQDDDDESYLLLESIEDTNENSLPEANLGNQQLIKHLVQAIEGLPKREQLLMGMYYEFGMNFREIAAVLGLNMARVSQLHTSAVFRIRNHLIAVGLLSQGPEDMEEAA